MLYYLWNRPHFLWISELMFVYTRTRERICEQCEYWVLFKIYAEATKCIHDPKSVSMFVWVKATNLSMCVDDGFSYA